MRFLLLTLEAPLMAMGGPMVDNLGVLTDFPAQSLLTGLLANALGYSQADGAAHDRLQARLRQAARTDRAGRRMTDYQTVDLGQPAFTATGWTTRGYREDRRGGSASTGTHQRWRPYWADRCTTVALALDRAPPDQPGAPTLDDVAAALLRPARALFLGRKSCPPGGRLLVGEVEAPSALAALLAWPSQDRRRRPDEEPPWLPAQWPADEAWPTGVKAEETRAISDLRDWRNQIHTGTRMVCRGRLPVPGRAP